MLRVIVILIVAFLVYSCAFGAVSGYKSASQPPAAVIRNDVHIFSENSLHIASDNKSQPDMFWLFVGGAVLLLVVTRKGSRNDEK